MKEPIKSGEKSVQYNELEEDCWAHAVPTFEPKSKTCKSFSHEIAPPVHDHRPVDSGRNSGETAISLLVSSGIGAIAGVTIFALGANFFRSFLVYVLGSVCLFIVIQLLLLFIRRGDG